MDLYVARDKRRPARHDLGSVLCLRVLDLLPDGAVRVHDCDQMRGPKPAWLTGTPTLATGDAQVLRGHEALLHLQRVAVETARSSTCPTRPARRPPPTDATPPPSGPPPPPAAAAEVGQDDDPWETRIDDHEDEEEPLGSRKITSDDLVRATQMRAESHRGVGDATAPPPLHD